MKPRYVEFGALHGGKINRQSYGIQLASDLHLEV